MLFLQDMMIVCAYIPKRQQREGMEINDDTKIVDIPETEFDLSRIEVLVISSNIHPGHIVISSLNNL